MPERVPPEVQPLLLLSEAADPDVGAKPDRATIRFEVTEDRPDERRLAAAVRPEQGDPLAGADGEVDALQDRAAAEVDAEPLDGDDVPPPGWRRRQVD